MVQETVWSLGFRLSLQAQKSHHHQSDSLPFNNQQQKPKISFYRRLVRTATEDQNDDDADNPEDSSTDELNDWKHKI